MEPVAADTVDIDQTTRSMFPGVVRVLVVGDDERAVVRYVGDDDRTLAVLHVGDWW